MNLKAYLAQVGVSAQDFAKQIDVTGRYLSQIVCGSTLPSRRLARDIEAATNGQVKVPFSLKTKKVRKDEEAKAEARKAIEERKKNEPDFFDHLYGERKHEVEREASLERDVAQ